MNNLVYAATGASVRTVLIDGRVVLDEGRLTTLDEHGTLRARRAAEPRARAPGRRPHRSAWPVIS